jgi:mono/diheme cytochrome c family protein
MTPSRRAEGERALGEECQMCHSLDLLEAQRLSRAAWQKELHKMIGWGAQVPAPDEVLLVDLLAERAGENEPPSAPRPVPAATTTLALDARPPKGGDASRGAALYRTACAACHGENALGRSGPALAERPVAYRAQDFARAVREGRGRMPAFPTLDAAALADLLVFMRERSLSRL